MRPATGEMKQDMRIAGNSARDAVIDAYAASQKSFYTIYSVSGILIKREEITSPYFEVDLPADPGVYVVYVYFDGVTYQRKMIVR